MSLPLDELVYTQTKWNYVQFIKEKSSFRMNGVAWRLFVFFVFIFFHFHPMTAYSAFIQTNFMYCPSAPLCSLFSQCERRKSQCDLPTHNLNCIHWSRKVVISNTVINTVEWRFDVKHRYFYIFAHFTLLLYSFFSRASFEYFLI